MIQQQKQEDQDPRGHTVLPASMPPGTETPCPPQFTDKGLGLIMWVCQDAVNNQTSLFHITIYSSANALWLPLLE